MDPTTKLYMAKFRMAEGHRLADESRLARSVRPRTQPVRGISVGPRGAGGDEGFDPVLTLRQLRRAVLRRLLGEAATA